MRVIFNKNLQTGEASVVDAQVHGQRTDHALDVPRGRPAGALSAGGADASRSMRQSAELIEPGLRLVLLAKHLTSRAGGLPRTIPPGCGGRDCPRPQRRSARPARRGFGRCPPGLDMVVGECRGELADIGQLPMALRPLLVMLVR